MSFNPDKRNGSRASSYTFSPKISQIPEAPSPVLPPNIHPTTFCAIGPLACDLDIISRLHIQIVRATGRDISREEFYLRMEGRPARSPAPLSPNPNNNPFSSSNTKINPEYQTSGKCRMESGTTVSGTTASRSDGQRSGVSAMDAREPDQSFREFVARCVGITPRALFMGVGATERADRKVGRGPGLTPKEEEEKGVYEKVDWGDGISEFDAWVDMVCKEVLAMRRRLDASRGLN
ncbi:uncharacterized protein EAF01_007595 [Botrytis porri]|uniref:Uncharacterized protein n=1 Tax=Botrytis porri TaxID=87229 RepID=A0A4Z1L3S5_9HELO|nr:uncharacterized protein EAF01_007595 [Botrytis porri]KAF7900293.1 hypothetical protein EAF01_007595 [Botrytis porri]TGO91474.1 hypothetical protein BPOR_0027g00270 [Botrytis porri]